MAEGGLVFMGAVMRDSIKCHPEKMNEVVDWVLCCRNEFLSGWVSNTFVWVEERNEITKWLAEGKGSGGGVRIKGMCYWLSLVG